MKVVFERLRPELSLFIERSANNQLGNNLMEMTELINLLPSQTNKLPFLTQFHSILFILDSSQTQIPIQKLAIFIHHAYSANPNLQFDIFLHKIDTLSIDYRLDTLQNLRERLAEHLFDLEDENQNQLNTINSADKIGYYLTSIYENSIWQAISKVFGKLLPEQTILERLLDLLAISTSIEKSFLFDNYSKIYIATDSNPIDDEIYKICFDYLDLISDFSQLYESVLLLLYYLTQLLIPFIAELKHQYQ